ncbi:allatostatin-A receptor-like [Oculina patagonica]
MVTSVAWKPVKGHKKLFNNLKRWKILFICSVSCGHSIKLHFCCQETSSFRQRNLKMDSNKSTWLPSNITGDNSSYFINYTETTNPIYVFTPAGDTAKSLLCSILASIGAMGFLGNCFIFYFLWQKAAKTPFQSSRFLSNLNLYIRSLSLSDLLSCAVSLPLLCIQISFDVFQSGWPCKIVRYFHFIFPAITMNNLVVISLEKYLSTRKVPRTFRVQTVRKMIICAWVLGITVMLVPAAAYNGIRVDLNNTHFTVICRNDPNFYPFKITLIIFPVQYIIPSALVIYINICLIKTVWVRGRRKIGNGVSNALKAKLTATRIKGTSLLIAVTFAFTIPYLFFIANMAYTQIAKPQREFSIDFITRYATGGIAYCSSLINFIIYFAQMKDFRGFLKCFLLHRRARRDDTDQQPEIFSTLGQSASRSDVIEVELTNWQYAGQNNVKTCL